MSGLLIRTTSVRRFGDRIQYAELNTMLAERLAEFEREVASRRLLEGNINVERLQRDRSKRKLAIKTTAQATFWEAYEAFIGSNTRSNVWSTGTAKRYRVVETVLREIELTMGEMTFEKIDRSFEEEN